MKNVKDLFTGFSEEDARSVIYFAMRYIKQAEHFDKYSKDIFDDAPFTDVSKFVKDKTQECIDQIEKEYGISASEFGDDIVVEILDFMTGLESSLSSDLSQEEIDSASKIAASLTTPASTD